jgi:hypothetical protein
MRTDSLEVIILKQREIEKFSKYKRAAKTTEEK